MAEDNGNLRSGSEVRIKHRFRVFSDDNNGNVIELGSFKSVGGLALETDVVEWKTGDDNAVRKLPGFTNYPAITLEKGFDDDENLKDWYNLTWDLSENGGKAKYRRDLIVKIYERDGITIFKQIRAKDAWISKYEADDLDGMSSDPWVERCEVQHNGWNYETI